MGKNAEVYTRTLIVEESDIDALNHVNNIVYLKWTQWIAGEHWLSRTDPKVQKSCVWVVISHYIEYKRPAFLGESITLKTYVGETTGPRSLRYVDIYRNEDLLAKAKTEWCLLDAKTMRPKRATEELMDVFMN